MDNEYKKVRKRLREAEGTMVFNLDCFGDFLSKQEGYEDLDGI